MATVTVTETGVRTQVNMYRNMNGAAADGLLVTVSGNSITNIADIPGRMVRDVDVTDALTAQQKAAADALMDAAEAYLKTLWNIP